MPVTTEDAERLARVLGFFPASANALRALAAERDALRAEIEKLRAALRLYADDNYNGYNGNGAHARAVLGEKE